jgi:dUTP pyrophosphatase
MLTWFPFSETATQPKLGTPGSAGYDLYSDVDIVIEPGTTALVQTNIGVIIPYGYYGRIAPRSGLAYKHSIDVFAGVIDRDYRKSIGVILYNAGKSQFHVSKYDRIAQMVVENCLTGDVEFVSLETAQSLVTWESHRVGGFGSTGV